MTGIFFAAVMLGKSHDFQIGTSAQLYIAVTTHFNFHPLMSIDYNPNDFVSHKGDFHTQFVSVPTAVTQPPMMQSKDSAIDRSQDDLEMSPPSNQKAAAVDCIPITAAGLMAMRKWPRILLRTWPHVVRHGFFDPASARKHNKSYLDMGQFHQATSYRDLISICQMNPQLPIALMGCGRDAATKKKKLNDEYFFAEYSFLQCVRFLNLVEMIMKMHPDHRNHCTMVLPNKPAHIYFDFDASYDAVYPHKAALYEKIKGNETKVQLEVRQLFVAYFEQIFRRQPDLSGLHWESASCMNKFSLHAHLITEAFLDIDHMKSFMAAFVRFIQEQPEATTHLFVKHLNEHNQMTLVTLMDASVYTKNRCFRLAGCCKPGKQALKWIPDPAASATDQRPLTVPDLIFRGLISHAIDVDPDKYLALSESQLGKVKASSKIKSRADKTSSGKDNYAATAVNTTQRRDKIALSEDSAGIVQLILRDESMLGGAAEVAQCSYMLYDFAGWCIVGNCKPNTAWCPHQTNYTCTPVQATKHKQAATNFSITGNRVKLWDWKCGEDNAMTVKLTNKQREHIQMILKQVPSAQFDSDSEAEADINDSSTDSECEEGQAETATASRARHSALSRPPTMAPLMTELENQSPPIASQSRPDNSESERDQIEGQPQPLDQLVNSRKRKVSSQTIYSEFDPLNLHNVDCHTVQDTRPKRATIEEIVRDWEDGNRKQIKKLRSKYGNPSGKSKLANKLRALEKEVLEDIVTYLNLYFKWSMRMPEPVVIVSLIAESSVERQREWQSDYMPVKAFETNYIHLNTRINGVQCNVTQMWRKHENCARFDKIMFKPLPDGVVERKQEFSDHNLWKGFKISAIDSMRFLTRAGRSDTAAQVRPFLEHLMYVWCKGEQALYNYTLNWMAWCIQRPYRKTEVSLVIRGDKGSGKGIIMKILGMIYGKEYYYHAQRADQLLCEFNDHLQSCLLCFVDEVTFANDIQAINILKGMITESDTTINTKHKSRYVLDSYMNLILAGNLQKLIECEGTERRFLVLETDDKWSGSQTQSSSEYFKRIAAVPPEALRYLLSRRDISTFNPRMVPSSKAMRDQKALSLSLPHRWWNDCLVRGFITDNTDRSQTEVESSIEQVVTESEMVNLRWQALIVKSQILPCFVQWCKDVNVKAGETEVGFWKGLHKLMRVDKKSASLIQEKRRTVTKGAMQRKVEETVVQFPALETCRQLFRDNVVHEQQWSFDQQGESSAATDSAVTDMELGLDVFD